MHILPISTPILNAGNSLAEALCHDGEICDGDILVISSKAVATVEGAAIDLAALNISAEAISLAKDCGIEKSTAFYQAVIEETARMGGSIIRGNHGVVLTELQPKGCTGTLLVPNAGLDSSNILDGYAIGWPRDPVESAKNLKREISSKIEGEVAVLLSDSCLSPRRVGVTAFALCAVGIDPLESLIGTPDLYKKDMTMTVEAVADQLAVIANFVMGNAGQSRPAAVIREHGISFCDFSGWVPGIERERDVYHLVL